MKGVAELGYCDFWHQVELGYAENYDIVNIEPGTDGLPLIAEAAMHMSESGYVLTRKAEMWSANSDEYVYFFGADSFDSDMCEQCIDFAYNEGMGMIDLDKDDNHMCTRVVAVFICDEMTDEAAELIKSCKIYKNFRFGLKGWMEMHTIGISLEEGEVVHNRYGRETAKFFDELLHPEKRKTRSGVLGIIKKMLD